MIIKVNKNFKSISKNNKHNNDDTLRDYYSDHDFKEFLDKIYTKCETEKEFYYRFNNICLIVNEMCCVYKKINPCYITYILKDFFDLYLDCDDLEVSDIEYYTDENNPYSGLDYHTISNSILDKNGICFKNHRMSNLKNNDIKTCGYTNYCYAFYVVTFKNKKNNNYFRYGLFFTANYSIQTSIPIVTRIIDEKYEEFKHNKCNYELYTIRDYINDMKYNEEV
jgi:hypothetical protein